MSDHVQRVAEVNDRFLAATKQTCLDASNKKWLDSLRNVTWNETAVACKLNLFFSVLFYRFRKAILNALVVNNNNQQKNQTKLNRSTMDISKLH